MMTEIAWWIPTVLTMLGIVMGYGAALAVQHIRGESATRSAEMILRNARRDADVIEKTATVQARDAVIEAREKVEKENSTRRSEISSLEDRLLKRESNLDRRLSLLDSKEQALDNKIAALQAEECRLDAMEAELNQLLAERRLVIQQTAALSEEEARKRLMSELEQELASERGMLIRRSQEDARNRAEQEARAIITLAIERYASSQVHEITTTTIRLPGDEMKGRLIGREGRNIRTLEMETGCNLLIDETPEVVVLSCFDPVRREVARRTLEALIADGRIHPASIEETAARMREDVDNAIREAGEEAIYELGLRSVAPEIVRTVGRLMFRQSYSQNVLQHSIETAHLMGMMASELDLDPAIAKRVGLFHDLGKALDHSVEGGHALIGAQLLRRHGESPLVVNAVASHHADVAAESLYAHLATAADAMTAARPGARSETTELYIQRLEKIEAIAREFKGVSRCFAIQAGRELRVLVEPKQVDEAQAAVLAREISCSIQANVHYPGQIRVIVIRETRSVEYAR